MKNTLKHKFLSPSIFEYATHPNQMSNIITKHLFSNSAELFDAPLAFSIFSTQILRISLHSVCILTCQIVYKPSTKKTSASRSSSLHGKSHFFHINFQ